MCEPNWFSSGWILGLDINKLQFGIFLKKTNCFIYLVIHLYFVSAPLGIIFSVITLMASLYKARWMHVSPNFYDTNVRCAPLTLGNL